MNKRKKEWYCAKCEKKLKDAFDCCDCCHPEKKEPMTTTKNPIEEPKESWEKQGSKTYSRPATLKEIVAIPLVKRHIQNLLNSQREEFKGQTKRIWYQKGREDITEELRKKIEGMKEKTQLMSLKIAKSYYIQALEDILKIL